MEYCYHAVFVAHYVGVKRCLIESSLLPLFNAWTRWTHAAQRWTTGLEHISWNAIGEGVIEKEPQCAIKRGHVYVRTDVPTTLSTSLARTQITPSRRYFSTCSEALET